MKGMRWFTLALCVCALIPMSSRPAQGMQQPKRGETAPATPRPAHMGPLFTISPPGDNFQPDVAYDGEHDLFLVVWAKRVDSATWEIWASR